jgi:hypothetical protein
MRHLQASPDHLKRSVIEENIALDADKLREMLEVPTA